MAFKQRSSTLEFRFRWVTLTVRVVDRFKRDKDKTKEAITIVQARYGLNQDTLLLTESEKNGEAKLATVDD